MNLPPIDILGASCIRVWNRLPYFMDMLFRLKPVPRPGIGTYTVDEGMRLYYDPALVEQHGVEYVPTFLAHEVQHLIREHPARGKTLRDHLFTRYLQVAGVLATIGIDSFPRLANYAADMEINDDLRATDFTWPPEWRPALPENFSLRRGRTMEEYVADIIEWAEKQGGSQGMGDPPPQGSEGALPRPLRPDNRSDEQGGGDSEDVDEPDDEDADGDGSGPGEGDDDCSEGPSGGSGDDGDEDDRPGAGSSGDATGDAAGGDGGPSRGFPGGGACGGCAGHSAPHEVPDADTPDPTEATDLDLMRRQVAYAVVEYAKRHGRGSVPGGWMLRWADQFFEPPKVDPMKLLEAEVRCAVGAARSMLDWKYGPPSRRRSVIQSLGAGDEAPLMAVLRGPEPNVVCIVDTSGSMGAGKHSRLADALDVVFAVVKAGAGEVWGIGVDAEVHEVRRCRTPDDVLELARGGGGTDMRVGVAAARDPKLRADIIILLTDGETPFPSEDEMPAKARLVTVIVNDYAPEVPEHMRDHTIYVTEDDDE